MTESEWKNEILPLMKRLWPKGMGALNDEQVEAYRRVCGPFSPPVLVPAVRTVFDTGRYFPRPADLTAAIRAINSGGESPEDAERQAQARRQAEAAERDRRGQEWWEVEQEVARLTPAEQEEHKRSALRDEPRLKWLEHRPVASRWWRAEIYRRLCSGCLPDSPHPPLKRAGGSTPREALSGAAGPMAEAYESEVAW